MIMLRSFVLSPSGRSAYFSIRHLSDQSFSKFLSYVEIQDLLEKLRGLPHVRITTIGRSNCGRDITSVVVSGDPGEAKPVVVIEGGSHGREWISVMTSLYVVHKLVRDRHLIKEVCWDIIPLLNPDGYEYSRTNERSWRKNVVKNDGPWCSGVDLNRNCDFKWGGIGSSSDECTETFRGKQPWSEPETKALRDHILGLRSSIRLYISLHSYLQAFTYPWSHTKEKPADWEDLEGLAKLARDAILKRGTMYDVGQASVIDRLASGNVTDWVKGTVGVKYVYLIELPGHKYAFNVPESKIAQISEEFYEAVNVFGHAVKTGLK